MTYRGLTSPHSTVFHLNPFPAAYSQPLQDCKTLNRRSSGAVQTARACPTLQVGMGPLRILMKAGAEADWQIPRRSRHF